MGVSPPDAAAVDAARRRGITLSPRASRRARDFRPTSGDLLVAMEPHQARALRRAHPRAQVTLLGLWCRSPRPVLADPYGLSDAYFDTCFGCIDEGVAALVQTVERRRAEAEPGGRAGGLSQIAATPRSSSRRRASLGAVGVIRSLGRAGYPVHACADTADALGLHSRLVRSAEVHPPYASPDFIPWVRETVQRLGIRAIVPSELFLLALRPALGEFQAPPAVLRPLADGARLQQGGSGVRRWRVIRTSRRAWWSRARCRRLEQLGRLGRPLWLKADGVHGRGRRAEPGAPGRRAEQAVRRARRAGCRTTGGCWCRGTCPGRAWASSSSW